MWKNVDITCKKKTFVKKNHCFNVLFLWKKSGLKKSYIKVMLSTSKDKGKRKK